MNAGDDADAVDWSCWRCVAVDVAINVEVADHGDVSVVEVVMDDEAAQSLEAQRNAL